MNRESLEPGVGGPAEKSLAGKALLAAAFFTCPCHIPIYIALFGGTALGGYLVDNKGISIVALSAVFVLSLLTGMRMIKARDTE